MRILYNHWVFALIACLLGVSAFDIPLRCSSFLDNSSFTINGVSIVSAEHYDIGQKNVSGTLNQIAFCGVSARVAYGRNSSLTFEVWLPDTEYSSRFMAIGNGGQAGDINYADMIVELNSGLGFAVAGSDAGHSFADNDVGAGGTIGKPGAYQPYLNNEDEIKAWLHDAINIFSPAAKEAINYFYGQDPQYSYFRGCSAGGAQGFSLAEFYPDLFDGIIAGCPANGFTRLMLSFLWNQEQFGTAATTISDLTLEFMQNSVVKECDLIDGVEDNVVENPLACTFNISSWACPEDGRRTNATCLEPGQLSAVKAVYQGPMRSDSSSALLYPGLTLASEAGWSLPAVSGALSNAFTIPMLQQILFKNLSYDVATFDWSSQVDLLDEKLGPLINSVNTNLSSFRNNDGKMIMYTGWADPNIAPMWSVQHAEAVTRGTLGEDTSIADNDFLKLVMIPGGGHCGAGNAKYPHVPASYDVSTALVEWVEKRKDPRQGIKSWGPPDGQNTTRRLCTWPLVAKLKDGEDKDSWESYVCG